MSARIAVWTGASGSDASDPVSSFALGQTEQNHCAHAVGLRGGGLAHGLVDRQLEDARHRADFATDALAVADEQRIDEAVGRQARFADQRADRLGASQAARPLGQLKACRRRRRHES